MASSSSWIAKSQTEAGHVLGVGSRQVADYISRGCPGQAKHYPIPEMIAWCKANVWTRAVSSETCDSPDGEKAALTKLRTERARLAQLDRLEREGEIVLREDVHAGLGILASKLHWGLELIEKDHPQAADILRETLDDMEREFRERFGYGGSG